MKAVIASDLHIHAHRNDVRRIEDGLDCLKWIYKTAEIAASKHVIIAGDFLHHRFSLPSYAYSKACDIVANAKEKNITTYFLLGNHDCYYEDNWTVNSLAPMRGMAEIIDKPTTIHFGGVPVDFLPYTPKPSKYLNSFPPSDVLISHLAVAEALLNPRYDIKSVEDDSKEKEIVEAAVFSKWKKVWLGHYHYGQKVSDNVEYLGSPMQLTFGEAGQEKHIVIFDFDTLDTKYVVNEFSPRFHIVDSPSQIDSLSIANSYVQMRCSGEVESKFDMRRQLSKSGAREIEFIPTDQEIDEKQTNKVLDTIAKTFNNKDELIEEYVKSMELPPNLDPVFLKAIGKSIISGT